MKKLLPIILVVVGIAAGIGAGIFFRPESAPEDIALNTPEACVENEVASSLPLATAVAIDPQTREYVRLNNQFIVPVVLNERVSSLIVLSLSIEVAKGQSQIVFEREPKLRDVFLQVLFNHANIGGFHGAFTETRNMTVLRRALREAGQSVLGDLISDILITDLARQDV
jgi:flagellar protein FliL